MTLQGAKLITMSQDITNISFPYLKNNKLCSILVLVEYNMWHEVDIGNIN